MPKRDVLWVRVPIEEDQAILLASTVASRVLQEGVDRVLNIRRMDDEPSLLGPDGDVWFPGPVAVYKIAVIMKES